MVNYDGGTPSTTSTVTVDGGRPGMVLGDSPWKTANAAVPPAGVVYSDSPWAKANSTLDAPPANYSDSLWGSANALVLDPSGNGGTVIDSPWKSLNIDISTKHTPVGIRTSKGIVWCEILIKSGSTLV